MAKIGVRKHVILPASGRRDEGIEIQPHAEGILVKLAVEDVEVFAILTPTEATTVGVALIQNAALFVASREQKCSGPVVKS